VKRGLTSPEIADADQRYVKVKLQMVGIDISETMQIAAYSLPEIDIDDTEMLAAKPII